MLCKVRGTVPLTSRQLVLVLIYLPEQHHILHTQCSLLASYRVSFLQCRPDHGDPCLKTSGLHRATRIEGKYFNLLRKGLVSACPWHLAYARTLCTPLCTHQSSLPHPTSESPSRVSPFVPTLLSTYGNSCSDHTAISLATSFQSASDG